MRFTALITSTNIGEWSGKECYRLTTKLKIDNLKDDMSVVKQVYFLYCIQVIQYQRLTNILDELLKLIDLTHIISIF